MLSWILRALGLIVKFVVCIVCKRRLTVDEAKAANWFDTGAGWFCPSCIVKFVKGKR
jgi:uncharacterized CHY-type Zn-finger protein